MSTDPNPSLAPNPSSEPLPAEVQQALAAGLGNFSLRELLGLVLTTLGQAERQAYWARSSTDKGNGSYPRSLKLGSIPLQIEVPRTRTGGFRPTPCCPCLPDGSIRATVGLNLGQRERQELRKIAPNRGRGIFRQLAALAERRRIPEPH